MMDGIWGWVDGGLGLGGCVVAYCDMGYCAINILGCYYCWPFLALEITLML